MNVVLLQKLKSLILYKKIIYSQIFVVCITDKMQKPLFAVYL